MEEMRGVGWMVGSAAASGAANRGWFLGPYVEDDARNTGAVQVKWCAHGAGEQRESWAPDDGTTSLCILVAGVIEFEFDGAVVALTNSGDYVLWSGIRHRWRALTACSTVTVRWVEQPE